ncbi:MAG: hypothetical protein ACAH21_15815 [Ramlibacter sp.]|nr:hypothetical protein [Ramlibacter sp.]
MNSSLCVALTTSPEQAQRLQALQAAFADVCNALAPMVQEHKCWNRVTLHHLAYKSLREQFPAIGSQMICNAIYSVSLTGRMVFQHPASPYHHAKLAGKRLPLLRFSESSPVYFDRHTLSLKAGVLSIYTLGGRMRCELILNRKDELNFHEKKLREVVLSRRADGVFELMFHFVEASEGEATAKAGVSPRRKSEIPPHVMVEVAA